ncbi:MAG: 2Fe-2S iron-sulfur cluster binding domain-containing protein [Saprospiraceae bacterium]|jgi:ring-1,2-phenylacetyl-CoA epoxidase subunit PaaE|nr:2Fe-2S iron-sulfur cluster binding domain-containing protein [Saprospiraceae bacterium]
MSFYSLKICKIVSETTDAKTLNFEIPADLKSIFQFKAGQFLTIKVMVNGAEIRRAYSLCTSPDADLPGVTVKKVLKGKLSVYLNDVIREGDFVDVMPPEGHFTLQPDHLLLREHYFIAAGSGITPVMSMIGTVLEHEPKSKCYLLYGNRNEENIIFKKELDQISFKYEDQLYITHVLSQPIVKKTGGIGGLFAKKEVDWKGLKGRINSTHIQNFIGESKSQQPERHYYICGPGDMIDMAEKTLLAFGIDKKYIHKEYFTTSSHQDHTDHGTTEAIVSVTLKGDTYDIVVPKGKTILDVLVDMKKDPPYSCTSGACSTCMAKVTQGDVAMDSCYALDDDEVAAGYILTCQSHPKSRKVEMTFDI